MFSAHIETSTFLMLLTHVSNGDITLCIKVLYCSTFINRFPPTRQNYLYSLYQTHGEFHRNFTGILPWEFRTMLSLFQFFIKDKVEKCTARQIKKCIKLKYKISKKQLTKQ